ncbi:MAG: low-specificity L-threonine aldolase [Alphaproteobacteria bacterium]|nr:low-specificity L-threonine aldolase [Alphaproteobacteria bacterium]
MATGYYGATEDTAVATGTGPVVDYRSDTLTKPTPEMRRVMAEAEVGDDVYGEDPSIHALEQTAAAMLGKEAAVLFPTGTQSNLAAVMSHCGRGEEYIGARNSHIFSAEASGAAVLGSVSPHPVEINEIGTITTEGVEAAVRPDDPHHAISKLLCLENTVSGNAIPLDHMRALTDVARRHGLNTHLDGARFFNAVIGLGCGPDELAAPFDTISVCLSKGLGAPVGSVLVGRADLIKTARRTRKMLGGGMRQAGVFAATGTYALKNNVARLADDHARARRLADALRELNGLEVAPMDHQTNMVFITPHETDNAPLRAHLREQGIVLSAQAPAIRMVLHLDIDDEGVDRTIEAFRAFYRGRLH